MFTPENLKKLTNVTIITYKKNNYKFELAAYPNKLHDYRHNITKNYNEILHIDTIFKNVSKGEIANKKDMQAAFGTTKTENIIEEILKHGIEKKDEKTRNYEHEKKEKEIINILMKKLTYNDKYLNVNAVKDLFKKFKVSVNRKEAKVQANEIIKIATKNGEYKRILMKIEVDRLDEELKGEKIEGNIIYVTGDQFVKLKEVCSSKNIKYVVLQDEQIVKEEFL